MTTNTISTKSQARAHASDIVDNWAGATLLTGWIPASGVLSGAADQVMIRQVADCFSVGVFNMQAVTAHIGGILGSSLGGGAAAELLSLVPVVGWGVKAIALSAKVKMMGELVIDYFEEYSPLPA